jgi:SAM-dependent methyltransferase
MHSSDDAPPNDQEQAIRAAYERYGVHGYYARFGAMYRNPHERAIGAALRAAVARWCIPLGRVLDLACGSGEVTLAIEELGASTVDGVDPYTYAAYAERTGRAAERLTFEQIAAGALAGRHYDTIVCSFALHLVESSRLPALALQISLVADHLLILTPHKRPAIKPEWGWSLGGELAVDRVRARYYERAWP